MAMMTAAALSASYALLVGVVWLAQRRLIYVPDHTHTDPRRLGLSDVEEMRLFTTDGASLVVWRRKADPGRPTILYFHGNAGNLAGRADRIRRYAALGCGVYMMSYRSYSGSTGSPSEMANIADANRAWEALIGEGVAAGDIIIYGESLGSGVAVQLAAMRTAGGLVLDAPFTSMTDMGARSYPFLPVRLLISDRYDSLGSIDQVRSPLLVLHGARDPLVPLAMGEALHAAARAPKKIVVFPHGGHTDLDQYGAVEAVMTWWQDTRAAR